MNNLTYYLTGIGGEEENNEGQRGNNKRKNKIFIEKINETKSQVFEKINIIQNQFHKGKKQKEHD